ncbi:unnamed protein product [Arabis nemorensis]|uniref:Thionin-like protein 2 n=1 Tax=Arabis nemorensis TaxID=586526 RepID=A0A565AQE6_9BRAS|nr:unnamed protein product [Arabis nemorensis]
MESKRVAMVTMMIVIVMGNLLAETRAEKIPFMQCFPSCLVECKGDLQKFPQYMICPFTCLKACLHPTPSTPPPSSSSLFSEKIMDQSDDLCKFGCAVHRCASLSTIQDPNVEKVTACVDSCSNECSNKN